MNRTIRIITVTLKTILVLSIIGASARSGAQELEWKVKVGDIQTYTVKECFDNTEEDSDEYPIMFPVTDEDGNIVDVKLKKGSILTVEVVALTSEIPNCTTIKVTYDGEITEKDRADNFTSGFPGIPFIMKTVDNKSYWEDQAEANSISVEGDLIVMSEQITLFGSKLEIKTRRNWKTGWLKSETINDISGKTTETLFELSQGRPGPMITVGWDVFILLITLTLIIPLKQHEKNTHRK